jgi:phenylacetate-CoA ligase
MSHFALVRNYPALRRNERLSCERLQDLQLFKLKRLIEHSWQTTPFWRQVLERGGCAPHQVCSLRSLQSLPVTTRTTLQAQSPDALTSSAFETSRLKVARTSGSSGRPFVVRCDPAFMQLRAAHFLRALRAGGFMPGERTLLLVEHWRRKAPFWLRWRYANPNQPAEDLLELLKSFRPSVLYASPTPLLQLARFVLDRGVDFPRPRLIFTKGESIDTDARLFLENQLGGRVFDIFGSTELGTIGFQCAVREGYHLAEDTAAFEFMPVDPGGASSRIVATNLDLKAMPFIRYDTGDLAGEVIDTPCPCGRTFTRVKRFEGRVIDGITLVDGGLLSPYALTAAIKHTPGLERYQVRQIALDQFVVRLQGGFDNRLALADHLTSEVRRVVRSKVHVEISFEDRIEPIPGCKFREIESLVTRNMVAR